MIENSSSSNGYQTRDEFPVFQNSKNMNLIVGMINGGIFYGFQKFNQLGVVLFFI